MNLRRLLGALGVTLLVLSAPTSASTDQARGLIADGRLGDALEMLRTAGPDDVEARFLRGVVLAGLDRAADAERVFRQLIVEYPEFPEPYNNLAVLLAESGRYDEAVETLKDALRTHESYRTAWDNLTTVYGRLASEAYSRALNLESPTAGTPVQLAMLGSLGEVGTPAMTPVETVAAVAVSEASEPISSGQEGVVPAEPVGSGQSVGPAAEAGVEIGGQAVVEPLTDETGVGQGVPDSAEAGEETESAPGASDTGSASPVALTSLVEAWARAWSEQRVDDYLSYYSDDFVPSEEMDLDEWKVQRQSRIEAPKYIRVEVAFLEVEMDGDEASVAFNQSYESSSFSDVVTKKLSLVRDGDGWKIRREVVTP